MLHSRSLLRATSEVVQGGGGGGSVVVVVVVAVSVTNGHVYVDSDRAGWRL